MLFRVTIVILTCRPTGQLESFHNVILPYAPKKAAFSKNIKYVDFMHIIYNFRNQSYQARIQLSVLDYNAHINRNKAKNKEGDIIYARKFRKQYQEMGCLSYTTEKKIQIYLNS